VKNEETCLIEADLHLHTKYSLDSSINPKALVDQLYAHPSTKVIAITDHNTIEGYFEVKELASAYQDILVIPGIEVGTPAGDLIVLGIEEKPPNPWDIKDILSFARTRGGVIIVPHPYREYGLGSSAKDYAVDAIETLNGNAPTHINHLAENLAKELNLPGVAGTDAHNIDELWTVYNEIQASLDIDEILKAVTKGLVKTFSTIKSIRF
jgi:predicted metal-dependent phosphoesterase TrpH